MKKVFYNFCENKEMAKDENEMNKTCAILQSFLF